MALKRAVGLCLALKRAVVYERERERAISLRRVPHHPILPGYSASFRVDIVFEVESLPGGFLAGVVPPVMPDHDICHLQSITPATWNQVLVSTFSVN